MVEFNDLHIHSLVHKMNSSTKATKMLIALCGKKLLKNFTEHIFDGKMSN